MITLDKINPLISIIIPVYKVENYLDRCLKSVVNQTYRNLEIILVDDGSPDRCPEMCDSWAEKDNRIKVIHKHNGGLSDARNTGIEIASGDLITFVDSDDWIEIDMYKHMIERMMEDRSEICICGINIIENGVIVKHSSICQLNESNAELGLELLFNGTISVAVWNKIYKRELFDKIRFPKGKIYEDEFTTPYILQSVKKITYTCVPYYNYFVCQGSILRTSFSDKRLDKIEAVKKQFNYFKNRSVVLKKYLAQKLYYVVFDVYYESLSTCDTTIQKKLFKEFRKVYFHYFRYVNIPGIIHSLPYVISFRFAKWYFMKKDGAET